MVKVKNHFSLSKRKWLSFTSLGSKFIKLNIIGKNKREAIIEKIRTESTVVGIYFIKSPIFPESINQIGINIEMVVKFHDNNAFQ